MIYSIPYVGIYIILQLHNKQYNMFTVQYVCRCLMKKTMMSLLSRCTRQIQEQCRAKPAGSLWMKSLLDQCQTRLQTLGASLCRSQGSKATGRPKLVLILYVSLGKLLLTKKGLLNIVTNTQLIKDCIFSLKYNLYV